MMYYTVNDLVTLLTHTKSEEIIGVVPTNLSAYSKYYSISKD